MSDHSRGASHYTKLAEQSSTDRPFIGGDMVQDQFGTRFVVYNTNILILSEKSANANPGMKLVARPVIPQ